MLLPGQDQIFAHAELRKYLQQLKRPADTAAVEFGRTQTGHDLAIHPHLAFIRHQLAEDAVEQGRLARTIRPDDAEDFALLHLEADIPHRLQAARERATDS